MTRYPDRATFTPKYTKGELGAFYAEHYDGATVQILGEVGQSNSGPLFRVQFPDGTVGGAFWDELGLSLEEGREDTHEGVHKTDGPIRRRKSSENPSSTP